MELLSIKQYKQAEFRRLQAAGLPIWETKTYTGLTGDVAYTLAPAQGYIRKIYYIKCYHTDAAASRYVFYDWLSNAKITILGSSLAANVSLILQYDTIPFPVVCYPGSSLRCGVNGLTNDSFIYSMLYQDVPNEELI